MEAQSFARDFFLMVNNGEIQDDKLTDHEEWLLREYAKLMKRDVELKKKENSLETQKNSKSEFHDT